MAVATAIQICLFILFSLVLSWQLMMIAAGFGLLTYVVVRPINANAKVLGERTSRENRDLSFYTLEYLRNLKLMKATASGNFAESHLVDKIRSYYVTAFEAEMNSTSFIS